MPYRVNWENTGCHLFFYGVVTGTEIKDAGDEAYGHEAFDTTRYLIFDFTEAEDVRLTLEEVKALAATDLAAARTNPRIRQAIVSTSETVDIGLAFYVSNAPELPWVTEGFGSLGEARAWLAQD